MSVVELITIQIYLFDFLHQGSIDRYLLQDDSSMKYYLILFRRYLDSAKTVQNAFTFGMSMFNLLFLINYWLEEPTDEELNL